MITYAQNFEDAMLARLFGDQANGFYVDIGASHPTELSVTKHFYDLGWSGVNIEPIRRNYELFVSERPRDVNLNVAIGLEQGERTFYEIDRMDALSTLDATQASALEELGYRASTYPVRVVTANEVFAEHDLDKRAIDFLKIDVEGLELEVVQSLDLRRFRPRVLLIEATRPASGFPGWDNFSSVENHQAWEPLVLQAGYSFAHFDGISRYYVRDEDSGLIARLAIPPGFFDNLVTWKSKCAENQLAETGTRLESVVQQLQQATDENAALTRQAHVEADKFAVLSRQLDEVVVQSQRLAQQLRDAGNENTTLTGRLRDADDENKGLSQQLRDARDELASLTQQLRDEIATLTRQLGDARNEATNLSLRLNDLASRSLSKRLGNAWWALRKRLVQFAHSLVWRIASGKPPGALPKITLVTPVFNGADYIRETLESVLRQEYPHLEYIVVDGGSTDSTLEIVRRYQARSDLPQHICEVISEPDQGMYDAIAKGFEQATGEVFCYLNGDDLLEAGALMAVGRYAADHPGAMVFYHEDTVLVDGWKFPNIRQPEGVDTVDLLDGHILFQDGVFFRRAAYQAVGGPRRDLRLAGDFDLWLRLSSRFRFHRRPGHVSCFRIRPGQLSLDMTRYREEMDRSRSEFLAQAPWLARVRWALAKYHRRARKAVRRRMRGERLFFPIDFGNLPPPNAVAPEATAAAPLSPVDGKPAERLLFSAMDTRFGERELNYIYLDSRHGIAITWPPIEPLKLDALYRKYYSSPPTEMVLPQGTSPYRQFNGQRWWERALLRLPLDALARFFDGVWSDNTLVELTTVLEASRIDATAPLRILDAGCFEGSLLDQIRDGKPWKASGLEPNERAVEVARGKGHEVWQGHAERAVEVVPKDRQFDVIFMGQSIEHVDDPVRVIRRLRLLLAPGGVLVMSTPNLDSREIDWFGPTWAHWHPPYHRYIFSRRGLEAIAGQVGLKPLHFRTFSHPYWTAMSIAQNWLGLGGSASHAVNFHRSIGVRAQKIEVLKRLFWNRLGKGDYCFLVAGEGADE